MEKEKLLDELTFRKPFAPKPGELFADALVRLRIDLELTQEELATMANLSLIGLQMLESGESVPSAWALQIICLVTGTRVVIRFEDVEEER